MSPTRRRTARRTWVWLAAFLLSIGLVTAAAGFILRTELRTSDRDERLVAEALRRAGLISRIRVDALALGSAIEAHIRAASDAERGDAEEVIDRLLLDLRQLREKYFESSPPKRKEQQEVWERFESTSVALSDQVRATRKISGLEPDRARQHLVEEVQPLLEGLDELASDLSRLNGEESADLQRTLAAQRQRRMMGSGAVLLLAVVAALLLGLAMHGRLRWQEAIIGEQIDELNARNRELDAFAGRVAHDLMSPLSPLQGHLTVARRSQAVRGSPEVSDHLERAQQSVTRVAGLVEALLRFCRAGSRGEPVRSSLDAVVNSQLLEVAQIAASSDVALERSIARGVTVDCPSQLLHCIAQNLLSNAVKYSAGTPGARVRVEVLRVETSGRLVVEDNGPGMPADVQAQLFRPFYRAPAAREKPGHGLGLATVKRLVEAHGGRLALTSTEGKGTRVVVDLPSRSEDAPGREANAA